MPVRAFSNALEVWGKLAQGLPEEALQLARHIKICGEDDQHLFALTVRAEARLRNGRLEDAAEDCAQALLMDPESIPALLVQGEVNLRLGCLAEAVEDCDAVIEREPG